MAHYYSLLEAQRQLENEMTDRQTRLKNILTDQYRCGTSAAERESLENEIENLTNALKKLEAQGSCDCCGVQVDIPKRLRFCITKYSEKLPKSHLLVEKFCLRAGCAQCRPKEIATKDEIIQAIRMLPSLQRRKLESHANRRVRDLGRANLGRTGEDLFQEALVATFTGTENTGVGRLWDQSSVDFFGFLWGAIEGISFNWRQKFRECEPSLECNLMMPKGNDISALEYRASTDPATHQRRQTAKQQADAQQRVKQLFEMFENHQDAVAILQGRLEGMTMREIMQSYGLTVRQYKAAWKEIRSKLSGQRNGGGADEGYVLSSRLRPAPVPQYMTNINASSKSVLIVHHHKSLMDHAFVEVAASWLHGANGG